MPKKIPMRQCLGCREMKPKKELTRVVRAPGGTVSIDSRGKSPGRGAYVCPNTACLQKALEIPQEIYETLIAQMEASRNE